MKLTDRYWRGKRVRVEVYPAVRPGSMRHRLIVSRSGHDPEEATVRLTEGQWQRLLASQVRTEETNQAADMVARVKAAGVLPAVTLVFPVRRGKISIEDQSVPVDSSWNGRDVQVDLLPATENSTLHAVDIAALDGTPRSDGTTTLTTSLVLTDEQWLNLLSEPGPRVKNTRGARADAALDADAIATAIAAGVFPEVTVIRTVHSSTISIREKRVPADAIWNDLEVRADIFPAADNSTLHLVNITALNGIPCSDGSFTRAARITLTDQQWRSLLVDEIAAGVDMGAPLVVFRQVDGDGQVDLVDFGREPERLGMDWADLNVRVYVYPAGRGANRRGRGVSGLNLVRVVAGNGITANRWIDLTEDQWARLSNETRAVQDVRPDDLVAGSVAGQDAGSLLEWPVASDLSLQSPSNVHWQNSSMGDDVQSALLGDDVQGSSFGHDMQGVEYQGAPGGAPLSGEGSASAQNAAADGSLGVNFDGEIHATSENNSPADTAVSRAIADGVSPELTLIRPVHRQLIYIGHTHFSVGHGWDNVIVYFFPGAAGSTLHLANITSLDGAPRSDGKTSYAKWIDIPDKHWQNLLAELRRTVGHNLAARAVSSAATAALTATAAQGVFPEVTVIRWAYKGKISIFRESTSVGWDGLDVRVDLFPARVAGSTLHLVNTAALNGTPRRNGSTTFATWINISDRLWQNLVEGEIAAGYSTGAPLVVFRQVDGDGQVDLVDFGREPERLGVDWADLNVRVYVYPAGLGANRRGRGVFGLNLVRVVAGNGITANRWVDLTEDQWARLSDEARAAPGAPMGGVVAGPSVQEDLYDADSPVYGGSGPEIGTATGGVDSSMGGTQGTYMGGIVAGPSAQSDEDGSSHYYYPAEPDLYDADYPVNTRGGAGDRPELLAGLLERRAFGVEQLQEFALDARDAFDRARRDLSEVVGAGDMGVVDEARAELLAELALVVARLKILAARRVEGAVGAWKEVRAQRAAVAADAADAVVAKDVALDALTVIFGHPSRLAPEHVDLADSMVGFLASSYEHLARGLRTGDVGGVSVLSEQFSGLPERAQVALRVNSESVAARVSRRLGEEYSGVGAAVVGDRGVVAWAASMVHEVLREHDDDGLIAGALRSGAALQTQAARDEHREGPESGSLPLGRGVETVMAHAEGALEVARAAMGGHPGRLSDQRAVRKYRAALKEVSRRTIEVHARRANSLNSVVAEMVRGVADLGAVQRESLAVVVTAMLVVDLPADWSVGDALPVELAGGVKHALPPLVEVLGVREGKLPGGAYGGERELKSRVTTASGDIPADGWIARHRHVVLAAELYDQGQSVVEISQVPSRVLLLEQGLPELAEVQATEKAVSDRLALLPDGGARLVDTFPASEGWEIAPAAREYRVLPPGGGAPYERTQHSPGVPVDGLPILFDELIREGKNKIASGQWSLENHDLHRLQSLTNLEQGRRLGALVMSQHGPGYPELTAEALATLADYLALAFTLIVALNGTSNELYLVKDATLQILRQELRKAYRDLTEEQRELLNKEAESIRAMFRVEVMNAHEGAWELVSAFQDVIERQLRESGSGRKLETERFSVYWDEMSFERAMNAGMEQVLRREPKEEWTHLDPGYRELDLNGDVIHEDLSFAVHTRLAELDRNDGRLPLGLLVLELRAFGNHHPATFEEYVADGARVHDIMRRAWNRAIEVRGLDKALLQPAAVHALEIDAALKFLAGKARLQAGHRDGADLLDSSWWRAWVGQAEDVLEDLAATTQSTIQITRDRARRVLQDAVTGVSHLVQNPGRRQRLIEGGEPILTLLMSRDSSNALDGAARVAQGLVRVVGRPMNIPADSLGDGFEEGPDLLAGEGEVFDAEVRLRGGGLDSPGESGSESGSEAVSDPGGREGWRQEVSVQTDSTARGDSAVWERDISNGRQLARTVVERSGLTAAEAVQARAFVGAVYLRSAQVMREVFAGRVGGQTRAVSELAAEFAEQPAGVQAVLRREAKGIAGEVGQDLLRHDPELNELVAGPSHGDLLAVPVTVGTTGTRSLGDEIAVALGGPPEHDGGSGGRVHLRGGALDSPPEHGLEIRSPGVFGPKLLRDVVGESDLWRWYIDERHHLEAVRLSPDNPGSMYDHQESPGYQATMSRAVERILNGDPGRLIDWEYYGEMFVLATEGTMREGLTGKMEPLPTQWTDYKEAYVFSPVWGSPSASLKYEVIDGRRLVLTLSESIRRDGWEGRDEGAPLALPEEPLALIADPGLVYPKIFKEMGDVFIARYEADDIHGIFNAVMSDMYDRINQATSRTQVLGLIAQAVRFIHIAHLKPDANGRVNIQLLLQKLLLNHGFKPVIFKDMMRAFSGGWSLLKLEATLLRAQGSDTWLPSPEERALVAAARAEAQEEAVVRDLGEMNFDDVFLADSETASDSSSDTDGLTMAIRPRPKASLAVPDSASQATQASGSGVPEAAVEPPADPDLVTAALELLSSPDPSADAEESRAQRNRE